MKLEPGRLVRWTSLDARLSGRRWGYVRRVTRRYVTCQLASHPDAATLSAQYRGAKVRIERSALDGIVYRKRLVAID